MVIHKKKYNILHTNIDGYGLTPNAWGSRVGARNDCA